jgi:predicted lysophospholipase L1 biosynthesis ABC-type transport system permease subunit
VETAPLRFIVNQAFVRKHLANRDPLDQSISVAMQGENPYGRIIGVVGDVKEGALDKAAEPTAYYVHAQFPYTFMTLVVRTKGDPLALTSAVHKVIHDINPELPPGRARTMEIVLGDTFAKERFNALLLAVFSGVALALAAIGVYGVLAYMVSERTAEIGLRLALGAYTRNVLGLMFFEGARFAAAGLIIGLLGAVALTRFLKSMLFEIQPTDAVTYVTVAAVIAVVAGLAIYLPARRAMLVDPAVTLHYE